MNYQKIYNQVISRAKDRVLEGYTEKHHIVPRCLGGTDDKNNLVNLTPEEHFVVHQLLTKINPDHEGLLFALRFMATKNIKHKRNNKEYGWIKRKISKIRKGHTLSVGEKNGMYGKSHTEHTKSIQSKKAKQRSTESYNSVKLPKTPEHKEKIRISKQVNKYIITSPEGIEYTFDRISDASTFSGVSTGVLIKLAGKRYGRDHCRHWQCFAVII